MENLVKRCAGFEFEKRKDEAESTSESRESGNSTGDSSAAGSSSPPLFGWPIRKASGRKISPAKCGNGNEKKVNQLDDPKVKTTGMKISEVDMMKERFAKLLLGEDMSGSGKGACTALAISNAITNLCASIFGQLWSLEPVSSEKKAMWRREMEMLLCVSDHIVELTPSMQSFPDGKKLEVMTCRPRSDLFANLPALRKLDNMLLEILDSFKNTEFWYVDQGIVASESDGSSSFRKTIQRNEEKWWLPVPRLPPDGLCENTKKQLNHTRECTTQILKAAMAINATSLTEMDVPESYLESLPKNGRSCLGDVIYRYITSDKFSAEHLLDCLHLASEHLALEIANRVEASIYVWRRRAHCKPQIHNPSRANTKSSWEIVKDLMVDGDKRELLAERAESILLCLKQRFPGLTQTTLDVCKIQCNKDVGKSILESYSRVLESLAYNIIARIDDLLYVDDLTKQSDKVSLIPAISHHKKLPIRHNSSSVPVSGTPFKPAFLTPSFSPGPVSSISPARGEKTPFFSGKNSSKINEKQPPTRRGLGVRKALSNYLGVDSKPRVCGHHHPADDDGSSSILKENVMEGGLENRRDSSVGRHGSNVHQSCPKYTVS